MTDNMFNQRVKKLKNEAVIVVDAWKHCWEGDNERYPRLEYECAAFGTYLDSVLDWLRTRYHIYHCGGGRALMDEIDWTPDTVLKHMHDKKLPETHDMYYIMGFHLGRCTHTKGWNLQDRVGYDKVGVVWNLSILFPEDSYNKLRKGLRLYNYIPMRGFTEDCGFCTNFDNPLCP